MGIAEELDRFEAQCLRSPGPCAWSWRYEPDDPQERLVVMVALHGDENAALPVLTGIITEVEREGLPHALTICVGNPEACRRECRAVHSDLNRVFDLPPDLHPRDRRRIQELRALFTEATVLLDLHQTRDPTPTGFYFLPDRLETRGLATDLDATGIAIAFAPRGDFVPTGATAVGYANRTGAAALGLELSAIGADQDARAVARRAVTRLLGWDSSKPQRRVEFLSLGHQEPSNPRVRLRPELENLHRVEQGETLGWDGTTGLPLVCPDAGRLLFPDHEGNKTFLYSLAVPSAPSSAEALG